MRIVKLESKDKILGFLERYNASTPRKLSDRVSNLEDYAEKLNEFARNYTICLESEPVGFFSFYDNDISKKMAYLTLIAVDERYQNMH